MRTDLPVAFGTFLGIDDPKESFGDRDFARTRYYAAPDCAFVAELDGRVVGSNFLTKWGSFAFFGPLTVEPALWDKGIAQRLLQPTMARFEQWQCSLYGLFTFSDSPKHQALYQKFGFWPRFLTALLEKQPAAPKTIPNFELFSKLNATERAQRLSGCRETSNQVYDGLDLSREITAVQGQSLGDTLIGTDDGGVLWFAVCHNGPGSEAGSDVVYVKFACVRPSNDGARHFEQLLDACESFAVSRNAGGLTFGVNARSAGGLQHGVASRLSDRDVGRRDAQAE